MASAASSLGVDPSTDELVRDARERYETLRAERRSRLALAASAIAVSAGVAACAIFVHGGPSFSWATTAFFVLLYAAVSRVEFEIGAGSAIPTQLVLVPMLFALPVGLVPAVVAVGLLLRATPDRPWPLLEPERVFSLVSTAAHAIGPTLVIGLAGGLPLRWTAWPIYVAALGAQIGFDFANALTNALVYHVRLRVLVRFVGLAYAVDAALAPVGLAVAFAARLHVLLALLAVPLVGVLAYFARERRLRIDNALELSHAYRGTAFLLGDVIEAEDAYTGSHSRHVVQLVLAVCDELALPAAHRRDAEFAALLHDVGKIRIPSELLNKPGSLDPVERELVETHAVEGERMLTGVGGLLAHVGNIVRSCHERWDGAGYPDRLRGEQIPLVARIVCACDAFSAMTTDRPYRDALSREEALTELARCAGAQFDPQVVTALIRVG